MRAVLLWTINNFPAYVNLSRWSTKGKAACPHCGDSTHLLWLKHGRKYYYMGHRRWLTENHLFRHQASQFDGNVELGHAPVALTGTEIEQQFQNIQFTYGKSIKDLRKRKREQISTSVYQDVADLNADEDEYVDEMGTYAEHSNQWKKKSIFFELPYWKSNLLRHNLDVMHIEKNVCDNILWTLLNVPDRTKDNDKARKDLEDMGIRPDLHLQMQLNGRVKMPPAKYTMSSAEKDCFLTVLKNLKVPDGYASNISRCVSQRRLFNLKSHDCHILMQDILPIALRASMSTEVVDIVSQLSHFFKSLCSKSLDPQELDGLQSHIIITLCHMEKLFPPSFFTIMVHLLIHLTSEAKLGGPVHYRWMYPIERSLVRFKALVRNRAQPEGSIAEGYIADECLTFCSRYFDDVETRFNRQTRNYDDAQSDRYLFGSSGRPIGKTECVIIDPMSLAQAHRYVLLHSEQMISYRNEFLASMRRRYRHIRHRVGIEEKWLVDDFSNWLLNQVPKLLNEDCDGDIIALARGPNNRVKKYHGLVINGYRFHSKNREILRKTQNSGVMVQAEGENFYGAIKEIIELDYYTRFKVLLFRCDWVDITSSRGLRKDKNGAVMVNFSKLMHTGRTLKDDPFILTSQARQVFYVQDPKSAEWTHVIMTKPRDLYELGVRQEDDETYTQCMPQNINANELINHQSWARNDINEED